MAKNTGKVREFCQSGKVGTLLLAFNSSLKYFVKSCGAEQKELKNITLK